ncbi:MAG TPA: M48 family metallopeptidase [Gemmatimonadales bacterium]
MNTAAFQVIVRRLERLEARSPASYRLQVAALALFGYAYLLFVLFLAIGVLAFIVFGILHGIFAEGNASGPWGFWWLVLPLLALTKGVLGALFTNVPIPGGIPLDLNRTPKLKALVRETTKRVAGPTVHRVLVTGDVSASAAQVPRFGGFGPRTNYLFVGLPLLQAMTPDEWRAILTHEMGHLSGNHGTFFVWILRLRQTWHRLRVNLASRKSPLGQRYVVRFVNWYEPYFSAYSFVLARGMEYQADQASVDTVGRAVAQQALVRFAGVAGFVLDRWWPGVVAATATTPEPPKDAWANLRQTLKRLGPDETREFVDQALRRPTGYADSHPSLSDRLAVMAGRARGAVVTAEVPGPPAQTAAAAYLGPVEAELEKTLSGLWLASITKDWLVRNRELASARKCLEAINAEQRELTDTEHSERLNLVAALGDPAALVAAAEEVLQKRPDHTAALYHAGRALLKIDAARGVSYLERAIRGDKAFRSMGCQILFNFFWSQGDRARAETYRAQVEGQVEQNAAASAERKSFRGDIVFVPTDLDAEAKGRLREVLQATEGVGHAYVANRVVKVLPDIPCRVVAVAPERKAFRVYSVRDDLALRDRVVRGLGVPHAVVVVLGRALTRVQKQLEQVHGAKLF